MNTKLKLGIGLALFLGLSGLPLAEAQSVNNGSVRIPANATPGAILEHDEQSRPGSLLRPELLKKPDDTIEGEPDSPVRPPIDAEEEPGRVLIRQIELENFTLLEPEVIEPILTEYEGKSLTFTEIQTLAARLTQLYIDRGYATSRVYIPEQTVDEGILLLKVLEGRVGELLIEEGRYCKRRFVKNQLGLEPDDVFNLSTLKRNVRRINTNLDCNIAGGMQPGKKPGTTDLVFNLRDRNPWHVTPSWDNMGRRLIGERRLSLAVESNNVTGFGDKLNSSVSFSRRTKGLSQRYEMPLGSHGTSVGFEMSQSTLRLGEEFSSLDVKGHSSTYSPFIIQELLNTENNRISADLALNFKQIDTDIAGQDFTRDQLRVLRAGLNWEGYDRSGRTIVREEAALGLDAFGAGNINLAGVPGAGANGNFWLLMNSITRIQYLPRSSYAILKLMNQFSTDNLVSAEQFQVGGAYTVRGYREGLLLGDSGLLASAELHTPFFFVPASWKVPFLDKNLRESVEWVSFLDFGTTYLKSGLARNEQILGAGMGLRIRLNQYLTARLDLGVPLFHQGDFSQRPRLHFGLESPLL